MHIDRRLETIANLVPQGCVLADIGTDHAYLPVWLLDKQRIARAIAGDIAAGPCQAARTTVAQFGQHEHVEVRQGSGLKVLSPGEADCIAIAGMGASTIISILEDDTEVAQSAELLVLQPMAGAASLRAWLCSHGWQLAAEELVDDAPHFYEIIAAKRGLAPVYSAAECAVGPLLLAQKHPLLGKQLERQLATCRQLLENMGRSERARASEKYKEIEALKAELEVWCKGDVLSGLFTADAAVIANGYAYLKGFAPETIATAILFSMVGYFNGNDKTLWVMVQGLVQTLLVRLPMAYIMSIQPNASLTMIGLSAPTSTAVGILLNICFFLWLKRYENQTSA